MSHHNTHGGSHRTLWVDLRAPFAICAAEAVLLLALLTLLAFFQVLEKHLMGGLTAGGVKG